MKGVHASVSHLMHITRQHSAEGKQHKNQVRDWDAVVQKTSVKAGTSICLLSSMLPVCKHPPKEAADSSPVQSQSEMQKTTTKHEA